MSANTSITEGGKARPFGPVKALMVQGEDGKYYPWFPESDRALGTLSVDKNGIYRASDKGVYGWSSVSVNVPTSEGVTGKDPDTGEEVYVHPDPETGELVTDVLPVEIRVIEPPTNPYGTYVDGQTITKDGMVVKAYDSNGNEMQAVPIGEITINPTVAFFDESKDRPGGEEIIDTPLDIGGASVQIGQGVPYVYCTGLNNQGQEQAVQDSPFIFGFPGGVYFTLAAVKSGERMYSYHMIVASESSFSGYTDTYTYNNQTVYYSSFSNVANVTGLQSITAVTGTNAPLSTMNNSKDAEIAWSMIYGEKQEVRAGSPQTITVSWPRPGDGAVLETTFDILVGPHGGTGDD